MKFFADIRTKRNTAFVALLVWLFALWWGVGYNVIAFPLAPGAPATPASVGAGASA